jgi:hypothetical protein
MTGERVSLEPLACVDEGYTATRAGMNQFNTDDAGTMMTDISVYIGRKVETNVARNKETNLRGFRKLHK